MGKGKKMAGNLNGYSVQRGAKLDPFPSYVNLIICTEVFGSTGSVGDSHFVRYSQKSITFHFFNGKFQFEDCKVFVLPENPLFPYPVLQKTSVSKLIN